MPVGFVQDAAVVYNSDPAEKDASQNDEKTLVRVGKSLCCGRMGICGVGSLLLMV